MVLHFAKVPPPIGGVTIHVQRLHNSLLRVKKESEILDYSRERNPLLIFSKVRKAKIVHIHVSNKTLRLFLILMFNLLRKKVVTTFHGKYEYNNLLDIFSLKLSNSVIVLNKYTWLKAKKIKRKNLFLTGAFIPPIEGLSKPLPSKIYEKVKRFKSGFRKVYCTNASSCVFDSEGKEIYMGTDLLLLFKQNVKDGLIFSDPSGKYGEYFKRNGGNIPSNVLVINQEHDFINIIKLSDALIRATTMDGDSLSIKEALFLNVPVLASDVVDRPQSVILFKDMDQLFNLINLSELEVNISEIKNSFYEILSVYKSIKVL